ncbi:MAG: hypothetical protein KJ666_14220 [Bacteroidetes bacterium]|nr:hypothetical protein [Bacteroidota bacterium]
MENGKNLLKYFDIKNKNIVHNTIACPFIAILWWAILWQVRIFHLPAIFIAEWQAGKFNL